MPTIYLRFQIDLTNLELTWHHPGPLFHRWLPNGKSDAIVVQSSHEHSELRFWFERRVYVSDHGIIDFAYDKREVDLEVMVSQGKLKGGPLHGLLTLYNATDDELAAIKSNIRNDPHYIALARRAVKVIYPPINRLLSILRTNYGQHWLKELHKWDSRVESIGN